MSSSLVGKNALTVCLTRSDDTRLKMFFDPYTKNMVSQYKGSVKTIIPGFDPDNTYFFIRPQRTPQNIHYYFSMEDGEALDASFWVQDNKEREGAVSVYHCFNCQAPSLYFSESKVVHYSNKQELKRGEMYNCKNPMCSQSHKYLGIVSTGKIN